MKKLSMLLTAFYLIVPNTAHACIVSVPFDKTLEVADYIFVGAPISCKASDEFLKYMVLTEYKGLSREEYITTTLCSKNKAPPGKKALIFGFKPVLEKDITDRDQVSLYMPCHLAGGVLGGKWQINHIPSKFAITKYKILKRLGLISTDQLIETHIRYKK